jgi:hypothetical protein
VGVDEILSLRAQREVCEDDIGAFLEEEAREFEVYALYSSAYTRPGGGKDGDYTRTCTGHYCGLATD